MLTLFINFYELLKSFGILMVFCFQIVFLANLVRYGYHSKPLPVPSQLYTKVKNSSPRFACNSLSFFPAESCEAVRKTGEIALQCGYQKRNKELISWAKRRRKSIPREDLLAYLAGKPPPHKNTNHHR